MNPRPVVVETACSRKQETQTKQRCFDARHQAFYVYTHLSKFWPLQLIDHSFSLIDTQKLDTEIYTARTFLLCKFQLWSRCALVIKCTLCILLFSSESNGADLRSASYLKAGCNLETLKDILLGLGQSKVDKTGTRSQKVEKPKFVETTSLGNATRHEYYHLLLLPLRSNPSYPSNQSEREASWKLPKMKCKLIKTPEKETLDMVP